MSWVSLAYENFENKNPGRCLLTDTPRLNLQQAFSRIASTLPDDSGIVFAQDDDGIAVRIHPYDGQDEPKLSYQFFSAHNAVVIRRIHAGEHPHQRLGSALIASQLPFWQSMGARYIDLLCSGPAEDFYRKLGFARVHMIPEYQWNRQSLLFPMRLDLEDSAQKDTLARALAKAPPLRLLL